MVRTFVRGFRFGALVPLLVLASVFSGQNAAAQDAAFKGPDTPVAFIMDASRSMLGEVEGRRRMDVARDAMLQLAPGPLQQGRASLVSFGNDRINECNNIPLIHPFGSDAVNATIAAIQTMEPAEPAAGEQSLIGSPLYRSIEVALETLPSDAENGSIVMVTDGVDACDRNICELVPALNERGISVDILAIDVNPDLLNLLACLPAGTGGALLPSDNLPTIQSYARLLSRAAAPEQIDVQPYLDEIGRLTAELAAMKRERDDLEGLRRELDADMVEVFKELDAANRRVTELETALASAEAAGREAGVLRNELAKARVTIQQLQDRIIALDAAVRRCEQELRLARQRIIELESTEPEEVVREVTVTKVVPDPRVVADLNAAKETLNALGCPFDEMDACEPGGAQDTALLAELDRLRAQLNQARGTINTLKQERDSAQAAQMEADKTVQRMIEGLALTASTYEDSVSDDYSWADAVASNADAGFGPDSVRANRSLMSLVSRGQSIQIIETDTSGLKDEVDALNGRLQAMTANISEANAKNADLRQQLNLALAARDAAIRERDNVSSQLSQVLERSVLLTDERDASVKLAEDRLAEIIRLTNDLQAQSEEIGTIAGQFNQAEDDRSTLQLELDRTASTVAARDETILILTGEVDSLRIALSQAQDQGAEAIADRDLLLEEIAKLDNTVETLLEKNRELQALMDQIAAQAANDRNAAEASEGQLTSINIELTTVQDALAASTDRVADLEAQLSEITIVVNEVGGELNDAQNTNSAVMEENQSLILVVNELRQDIEAKQASAEEAETTINTLNLRISDLEAIGLDNEAFFDVLITQCTALLGLEGDTGNALDRETLAFECAAAFESAQRWRADLTEMVELRDRSLQACEARYASLDARAKSLAEGVCSN
ncbi:MAG: hypothetical protein ACPG40_04390 [Alphaproteobacteria bacterium]